MNETLQRYLDIGVQLGVDVGSKILGAMALWIVGRFLIRGVLKVLDRTTKIRKLDETLARYLHSVASVLLNILLVITVLGVFGVQTFTFAGILAAAGVAIGVAWSGLLANLAAGVFMIVLRPFKAGDAVTVGGVTGIVHSIGLFVTAIDTFDNVRTYIGNNKIFGETIQNYSANPTRRVDLLVQLSAGADVQKAIAMLREKLPTIPHVMKEPAPVVEINDFNLAGPVLAVRPTANGANYLDVLFATNKMIHEEMGKLGFPAPAQPVLVRGDGARISLGKVEEGRSVAQA